MRGASGRGRQPDGDVAARVLGRRRPTSTPPRPTARRRCTGRSQHDDLELVDRADSRPAHAPRGQPLRRDAAASGGDQRQRAPSSSACSLPAPIANAALPDGETALMTAARTGNADAVQVLLAHGADVNAREASQGADRADVGGGRKQRRGHPGPDSRPAPTSRARSTGGTFTPLLFAVRGGHVEAARALLDAGADVNERAARRHERARAGHLSTRTTSWRRSCSIAAPTRTPPRRAGPRCIRWRGRGGRTAASTCRAPCRPAASTAWNWCRRLVAQRRRRQRAADEGAARRQPQHAEPDRRDAVPDGGEDGRRPADAAAARARRRSRR